MQEPATLEHTVLHLLKCTGELAAIAEHLQHEALGKQEKGKTLARRFLQGRQYAMVWAIDTAETRLREVLA
jgi:hypothetical protein